MDLVSFLKPAVAGVPLVFVIMGLVEWLKRLGVTGNNILYASMGIGVVIGSGYMVTQTRPPLVDAWIIYVYWFAVIVYGLAMGIVASGLYDVIKNMLKPMVEGK